MLFVSILSFILVGVIQGVDAYRITLANFREPVDVRSYIDILRQSVQKESQIAVFPECGLRQFGNDPETVVLGSRPCNMTSTSPILSALACESVQYPHLTLVFDLLEKGPTCVPRSSQRCPFGNLIYNTVVVLEQGKIIFRFRKVHPYAPIVSPGSMDQKTTFVSAFGVRFGVLICYDVLFSSPLSEISHLGVTDVIYPSFWEDQNPLDALQMQQSTSEWFGITLLSSSIMTGLAGSGVFSRGRTLALTDQKSLQETGSDVLVLDVESFPSVGPPKIPSKAPFLNFYKPWRPFEVFSSQSFAQNSFNFSIKGFTCLIRYKIANSAFSFSELPPEYFVATASIEPIALGNVYVDYCGLMNCGSSHDCLKISRGGIGATNNTVARTVFESVEIEVIYGEHEPVDRVLVLKATDGKMVFRDDEWKSVHDGLSHQILSTEHLNESLLFAGMVGLRRERVL